MEIFKTIFEILNVLGKFLPKFMFLYGNLSIYVLLKETNVTKELEHIVIFLRCSLTSSEMIDSIEIQFLYKVTLW